MIRACLIFLAATLLAACGAMETATGIRDPFGTPQPFQGTGDQRIIGGVLSERPVYIGAIAGLDKAAETALRTGIANAAGALDVLASADQVPNGALTLTGRARAGGADFTLFDGDKALTSFGADGDQPGIVAAVAAQALASALGRLGSAPPAGEEPAPVRAPVIFVAQLNGPSDKIEPLRRAVVSKLAEMGATMADSRVQGSYFVTGTIGFGPDQDGRTAVSIIWKVIAPDGTDLGQAAQDNILPTAAVQGNWAESAALAGGAAAGSIAEIIAPHFNKPPS